MKLQVILGIDCLVTENLYIDLWMSIYTCVVVDISGFCYLICYDNGGVRAQWGKVLFIQ